MVTHFENVPSLGGQLFVLTVAADAKAALGDRGLQLVAADGTSGPPAPGMLRIVPAGSLAAAQAPLVAGLGAPATTAAMSAADLGAAASSFVAKLKASKRSLDGA